LGNTVSAWYAIYGTGSSTYNLDYLYFFIFTYIFEFFYLFLNIIIFYF